MTAKGGDNILVAGAGGEPLTGGEGRGKFRFDVVAGDVHLITDYEVGADLLVFRAGLMGPGVARGAPDPALFTQGGAVGSEAQFIWRAGDVGVPGGCFLTPMVRVQTLCNSLC
ncbi:MAG: hypothetical protein Q7J57_09635 [Gemmobacter sp.]|nr:hypothetical protein [Gemmobacter sp.]